ncbi:unnamed protein product, partial [Vitis vinifera]
MEKRKGKDEHLVINVLKIKMSFSYFSAQTPLSAAVDVTTAESTPTTLSSPSPLPLPQSSPASSSSPISEHSTDSTVRHCHISRERKKECRGQKGGKNLEREYLLKGLFGPPVSQTLRD